MRCALVILCAVALLLTACGGGGPEEPDGVPPFEDTQSEQPAPDNSDASTVSGKPDAPPVTDEPAPDDTQTPPVPDEPPSVPDEPDDTDAQLLGELLPEVTAVGEGVSVGKLSYDSSPDSCTVYLPEGQAYVPFLVLSADYGGNALLLRRDVLPEARPFNNYGAAYEDSAIDRFLNGEYLQRLDAVKDLIRASEIVVTDADALGVSGTAVKTLTRNVFLLSCAETGFTEIVNAGTEGAALSYFDAPEHRIAYGENGAAASWRLRTPDAYYASVVYGVGPDGSLRRKRRPSGAVRRARRASVPYGGYCRRTDGLFPTIRRPEYEKTTFPTHCFDCGCGFAGAFAGRVVRPAQAAASG